MLSVSEEETFGYAVVEAMSLNTIPLTPNNFAYPEVIGYEELLYDEKRDLERKLRNIFLNNKRYRFDVGRWEDSIKNMIEIMRE
jgi:hypothetical protein